MLGTRRPGVTEAMHALAQRGLVCSNRGIVTVVDRKGLMEFADTLYGVPEAEYRQKFGEP
jgi:DNA-binding FadR family transcriptional regulator